MGFLNWFKEVFRKKEYYQAEYEVLNNFGIEFTGFSEDIEQKLKKVILEFKDAKQVNDPDTNLYVDSSKKFESLDDLYGELKNITLQDYRETYFEAQKENWDFNYFVTDSGKIYNDTLFISNKLSYLNDNSLGDVMYPVLAIKKCEGVFYIWNLLDKDNE